MTSSRLETGARIVQVDVTGECLSAHLADGRVISVPLAWYPRLLHGTPRERARYELSGDGYGIHWPDLDEDISIQNLLEGHRSGEAEGSFRRWLDGRRPPDRPRGL